MQREMFPSTKKCRTCHAEKAIDEFSRMASRTEKRRGSCKPCERKKMEERSASYNQCVCGALKRNVAKRCTECHLNSMAVDGIKLCHGCGRSLCVTMFNMRRSGNAFKLRSRCRECECKSAIELRNRTPVEIRRERKKRSHQKERQRPYAIRRAASIRSFCRKNGWNTAVTAVVLEKYKSTSECEICHESVPLVIDHCHERNVFRGLLCSKCNSAIGLLRDNPAIIRSAAKYILKAEKTLGPKCEGRK